MILAIDTSTEEASVALMRDAELVYECTWLAQRNHSRHLTPAIRHLFALSEQSIRALSGVVVAIGPGSFSGLRVGISEAKGIAMARGVPLAGVNTLELIAFQAAEKVDDLWVVMSAGRGEYAAACFRSDGKGATPVTERFLFSGSESSTRIPEGALLGGPAALALAAELSQNNVSVRVRPAIFDKRRAGFLAELGRQYFSSGGENQLFQLEPVYLRRSAAEERRSANAQE